jgi:hypothetical protein
MANITVDVDIDLDEFDLDEILEELENRWNAFRNKKENREQIREFFIECDFSDLGPVSNLSLIDKMKIDFITKNLDKIKMSDLENLI